ncbi:MAG: glycosyltransferase family 2 protein [Prevotella sp.]|nr:glycosyltransferase family 2 protein [Prevotella sp.]
MKSLHESTVGTTAIIIDNGSTDETREHVPSHYPEAIWMPQEKNLGFGQANNLGIRYALEHNADYVLLLNQDAAISPDAIEKMLAVSDGESLLSPLHLNGDGTRIDEILRYSLLRAHNLMNDDLLIRHKLEACYQVGEICAACWLMPIAVIKKIGGFNPLFFHYGEDNNYDQRMQFHKVKTLLIPNAFMMHDRKLQGNVQMWNHKRLRRDLLLEATNINQGIIKCMWRWVKILVRCYNKDLRQQQYHIGAFTLEILWIICHVNSIRLSRIREKRIGATWLERPFR